MTKKRGGKKAEEILNLQLELGGGGRPIQEKLRNQEISSSVQGIRASQTDSCLKRGKARKGNGELGNVFRQLSRKGSQESTLRLGKEQEQKHNDLH